MSSTTWVMVAAIILYTAMMVYVGIRCSKKNKTTDDFYLGGRKLGPIVTAMSAEASDMSAWLLMGLPGLALMTGLAEATWTAIGLAVGTYLNWLFVAKRLRNYTEKVGAVTLPEFFSKRFKDEKNILAAIAAIVIIIFFIPYTASGFSACGKLFSNIFSLDYSVAMLISAVVIVLYCTLGGFLAASTTDLIQSIIMTFALLTALGIGEGIMGGFGNIFTKVKGLDGYLDITKGFDVASGKTGTYGSLTIASTLAWGLGYFGMPHVLLRFMAIDDAKKLKTSRRIASVWVVISMAIAVLIGVVGYSLMKAGIVPNYDSASSAETIFVDIAAFLTTTGYIPALVGGIFLAGILASTMSTADSQLIAASSSVARDLAINTFKVRLSDKTAMLVARASVIVIAVIAVFLAKNPNSSVFRIVSFAWAGFGAAFGPVMLFSLFWKRTTKWGALAGMVSGGAMVFIWKFIVAKAGGVWAIYELLPAFIIASVFIVIVSLLDKKPSSEIVDEFETVGK